MGDALGDGVGAMDAVGDSDPGGGAVAIVADGMADAVAEGEGVVAIPAASHAKSSEPQRTAVQMRQVRLTRQSSRPADGHTGALRPLYAR